MNTPLTANNTRGTLTSRSQARGSSHSQRCKGSNAVNPTNQKHFIVFCRFESGLSQRPCISTDFPRRNSFLYTCRTPWSPTWIGRNVEAELQPKERGTPWTGYDSKASSSSDMACDFFPRDRWKSDVIRTAFLQTLGASGKYTRCGETSHRSQWLVYLSSEVWRTVEYISFHPSTVPLLFRSIH